MQDDPYKTPESDLIGQQPELPKTLWWKALFFTWALFLALALIGFTLTDEIPIGILEVIDLSFSLVTLVALFGLAFNKAIGKRVFWQYFFYVNAITSIVSSIVFPLFGIEIYGTVSEFNLDLAVGILIGVLFLWATYVYGYRRGMLW